MAQNEAAQKAAAQVRNFIILLLEQMYYKIKFFKMPKRRKHLTFGVPAMKRSVF